ncbi:UDP-glucosyltransferase protein 3 [Operophtera brumata]|uniref:UDP-glucosyltransferase protein 3 n=1 Tax=Operophtera brumata TaxID=104452 RepID=A0A0L7L1J2_OPEBR|nr:UDP-glucosyltransferase protein 3 [Operophtera brumata]
MASASLLLLTLLAASYDCDAYKILVVFPLPATSHGILGDGVVRHLLNAGHEVSKELDYVFGDRSRILENIYKNPKILRASGVKMRKSED